MTLLVCVHKPLKSAAYKGSSTFFCITKVRDIFFSCLLYFCSEEVGILKLSFFTNAKATAMFNKL